MGYGGVGEAKTMHVNAFTVELLESKCDYS